MADGTHAIPRSRGGVYQLVVSDDLVLEQLKALRLSIAGLTTKQDLSSALAPLPTRDELESLRTELRRHFVEVETRLTTEVHELIALRRDLVASRDRLAARVSQLEHDVLELTDLRIGKAHRASATTRVAATRELFDRWQQHQRRESDPLSHRHLLPPPQGPFWQVPMTAPPVATHCPPPVGGIVQAALQTLVHPDAVHCAAMGFSRASLST